MPVGTNFFPALNALRDKLDEFYVTYRRGDDAALQLVVNQLQEQLDAVTARIDDAGAGVWQRFAEERPWGYELLQSLAEAVQDELKRLRHEKNLAPKE
jgi:hypothetical protein